MTEIKANLDRSYEDRSTGEVDAMQWRTDEPPINTQIEYERDNGVVTRGKLAYAGEFGIGNIAASGKYMRRQFTDHNGSGLFEVKRWRALDAP